MALHQGDIVIIPVPFTDNEGYKLRPAVVISNEKVHSTGDTLIVQITSRYKNDGLSIEINPDELTVNLPTKSFIRYHKIFVLEQKLIKGVVSHLNSASYNHLIQKINQVISQP